MGDGEIEDVFDAPAETYLAVSDPHLSSDTNLNTSPLDADEVLEDVERYGEEYDCDELLVGGDVGTADEIKAFLDLDFERVRAVEGNHDLYDGGEPALPDGTDYGEALLWREKDLQWAMRHRPSDFGLQSTADRSSVPFLEPFDIVLYGHSHLPYERVLEDGTLAVGMGSLAQNKQVTAELPDRSFYVLDVFDDEDYAVGLRHVDFDTGEVLERSLYVETGEGFEEVCSDRLDGNRHRWQS
ncbi:MAG: metallophosphoesterase family protein [Candidatus Nanohaloarchaea archaeon]|nr:metallophosphoesterase family protein [Candidatus Nanohaloarchaea archaeon]